jgi:Domain of unknown function (DUF4249)
MRAIIPYKNLVRLGALLAVAAYIFSSCQKVVNLNLNTANTQIVIVGYVTDQPGIDTVKITKTGSYFNAPSYPAVTNAEVIITDNTGLADTLVQVDSGVYVAPTMTGVAGRTYTMKALINGKEYDAISTMPQAVNIDSIQIYNTSTVNVINGVSDTTDHVRCYFKDPVGIGNYYRVLGKINGLVLDSVDDFNLLSDEFVDGAEINRRLSNCNPIQSQTVTVQLQCIDAGTYNYYEVVRSIASAGNPVSTAVPQNPPTNLLGGALGYFSAYPVRTMTGVAP